ncbi:MAG: hypothetical protein J5890_02065 [Clostridia bacterium]|nr:hypothetical protein [Clostridia bacterium]
MTFIRELWKAVGRGLYSIGAAYSIFNIVKALLDASMGQNNPVKSFEAWMAYVPFALGFIWYALKLCFNMFFKKHGISDSRKTVGVRVSDILKCKRGTILVGMNDTLCCDMSVIGDNSIQYQLLKKYRKKYGTEWMESACEKERRKFKEGEHVPMGYTFTVKTPDNNMDILFMVVATFDGNNMPESSEQDVRNALKKLFAASDFRCVKNTLYMPVIGTGRLGLPISKQKTAENIAFDFIKSDCSTNKSKAIYELIITIHPASLKDINLYKLHEKIKHFAQYCNDCPEYKA